MKKWRKAIENAPIWALFLSGIGVLILAIFTVVSGSFMSAGNIPLSVLLGLITIIIVAVVLFFLIKLKGAKEFQKKRRRQENIWRLGYGLIFILSFLVFSHAYNILFVQKSEVDEIAEKHISYLKDLDINYNEYVNVLRLEYKTEMENALKSPNKEDLRNFERKYHIDGLTKNGIEHHLNAYVTKMRTEDSARKVKSDLAGLMKDLNRIKKIDGYIFTYPQKHKNLESRTEKLSKKGYPSISKNHQKGRGNPFVYNGEDLPNFKDMSNPFNLLGGNFWLYIAFLVLQFLILSAYVFAKRPSSLPQPPGGLPRNLTQNIVIDQGGIIITK